MKRRMGRYGILVFVVAAWIMSVAAMMGPSVAYAQAPFGIELKVSKDTIFVNDEFQLAVHVVYTSEAGSFLR